MDEGEFVPKQLLNFSQLIAVILFYSVGLLNTIDFIVLAMAT